MNIERDKSWSVYFEKEAEDLESGWYYYLWSNEPYGPFETKEAAWNALDDAEWDYSKGEY